MDACEIFFWILLACIGKKNLCSCDLGVPVTAATHTCRDITNAVELGLPLVAAKKPNSFIEQPVPPERYCICKSHIFMF